MREAAHVPKTPTPILRRWRRAGIGKNSLPTPLPFCPPADKAISQFIYTLILTVPFSQIPLSLSYLNQPHEFL